MKKSIFLGVIFLLSACAYSPQQITIKPQVAVGDEVYGQGRSVAVEAEDRRASTAIGSRGGAYPDTSLITPANDISAALVEATKAGLRQQGFLVDSTEPAAAKVKVVVDTLSYENDKDALTTKVILETVLLLEVSVAEKTYTGRYKSATSQQMVVKPSAKANELMINTLLSDTLRRALQDPKVKAFLSNS